MKIMETNTLVKWIENIDRQLKDKPDIKQFSDLIDRKGEIVMELHKRGVISDEGRKEFLLSEIAEFTPILYT
jgi:hypothetical protein